MNRPTPRTATDRSTIESGTAAGCERARDEGPEPWVVCRDVSRHFGSGANRVVAVDEVCVCVAAGMRVALTGSSGSGKSTLLHLMAGLDQPTRGRVTWPGLGGTPAGRPDLVGVVFQGPSLIPDLDVFENVGLPLLFQDRSRTRPGEDRAGANQAERGDPVAEAMERVGIAELGDKLPEELSGGQAQRVAVARVLVARPTVILADEPTGQLDRETGRLVVSVLLDAATELGAALVVATHDLRVAERLTEQWHMHDGRLVTSQAAPAHDRGAATSPGRNSGARR